MKILGYAAMNSKSPLTGFSFERRQVGAHDVLIDILFCGVCHSDIHQARDEWGGSVFPMVPGHEIVGKIAHIGPAVTKFKVGENVGVGCFVDSCRACRSCHEGLEQYCEGHSVMTYNGTERDLKTPTFGGYSQKIVVDENYVLRIPKSLDLAHAAPLLCAGITTYSPLRHWNVGKGQKVAVLGLGGLGHMAVKLAAAMGAEVTVLSSSDRKRADALRMGAKNFVNTSDKEVFRSLTSSFDLLLNTVSAPINLALYLNTLKRDATMVLLGIPDRPEMLPSFPLIGARRRIAGSLIGGIRETQEMLDFCADHGISSDVEVIEMAQINEAYERMIKGDVRYRFVIDLKTL